MLLARSEGNGFATLVQGQGLGLRAVLIREVACQCEVGQISRQAENAEGDAFSAVQGLIKPGTDRLAGGGR